MTIVRPGIEKLRVEGSPLLEGKRVGLLTHPAAVDSEFNSTYRIFATAPSINLVAFFAPEHGFMGTVPDGVAVDSTTDPRTGKPVYSLYGKSHRPTREMLETMDVLVVDIQDVGVRYYTFIWTISYILEAAGLFNKEVVILDRPNPLGDRVYGLPVYPEAESFVGRYNIPVCHGMTIGELSLMINARWNLSPASLHVIRCEGLKREMWWTDTGLDWIATSPAMPHFLTVLHYPGSCLIEGTTLSEGRGTALPFEIVGAPYIDGIALADHLNKKRWPGVRFRPHFFRPGSDKYAGQDCQGVQAHIVDKNAYHPFHVWLGIIREIREMYPAQSGWLPPQPGSFGSIAHFDRLTGSPDVRQAIDDGASLADILKEEKACCDYFLEQRKPYLLYP